MGRFAVFRKLFLLDLAYADQSNSPNILLLHYGIYFIYEKRKSITASDLSLADKSSTVVLKLHWLFTDAFARAFAQF